jgi:hypothetical protein
MGLLSVSFWVAMLIGATVASTDPIVATTIVTGDIAEKYVPERVRHFISAESGANDGAVYPLVLLPILVLTQPQGEVISRWLVDVIGWQIGGAVLLGAILGYGSLRLLTWTESVGIVENHPSLWDCLGGSGPSKRERRRCSLPGSVQSESRRSSTRCSLNDRPDWTVSGRLHRSCCVHPSSHMASRPRRSPAGWKVVKAVTRLLHRRVHNNLLMH